MTTNSMFELFRYGFMVRGLEAGVLIALVAPLIGTFLVLRRYSLIADTLAHVSLAGVAAGILLKINPIITALVTAIASSVAIERLRENKRVYGETALSIFLSGGLATAIVLIGLANGLNTNLFSYLFGSIVTVKPSDITIIIGLAAAVCVLLGLFYKELIYVAFDEEAARVSGIPTRYINALFMVVAATTISLAIPIVGVLLISALMVVPVITALQLKKSFIGTVVWSEFFSLLAVVLGIVLSFYLNLSPGGVIVLMTITQFVIVLVLTSAWAKRI